MRFSFSGPHEFELDCSSEINWNDYKFILFSSQKSQKVVYNYYKNELQPGYKINEPSTGKSIIKQIGAFDQYPKLSWKLFKEEICPVILYHIIRKEDNLIELKPLNIFKNKEIFKNYENNILRL